MSDLGKTIREIRKANGETGHVFAARLGVRQSTLSQYESGTIRPGAGALLHLHEIAKTPEQRARIREALGPAGEQLRTDQEKTRDHELAQLMSRFDADKVGRPGTIALQRFQELCIEISKSNDPPLWLIAQMELWLDIKDYPAARERFEELFHAQAKAMRTLKEARDILAHQRVSK